MFCSNDNMGVGKITLTVVVRVEGLWSRQADKVDIIFMDL